MTDLKNKKSPEDKKGFPKNIFSILFLTLMFFLVIQNFMEKKPGSVSFSYQLEPLVNLDLIKPDQNKKVALKDKLVNFSGQFKDKLSSSSKERFHFLTVLKKNHDLKGRQEQLGKEVKQLQVKTRLAGELFLGLSGIPIPKLGYDIVDESFNTLAFKADIIVLNSQNVKSRVNFTLAQEELATSKVSQKKSDIHQLRILLTQLIEKYLSPALGIGSDRLKTTLNTANAELQEIPNLYKGNINKEIQAYSLIIDKLAFVNEQLNKEVDHFRLTQIRFLREYKKELATYISLTAKLEGNQLKLKKAEKKVHDVIWFFNDKEISTTALMSKQIDVYNQWFSLAKQEMGAFEKNKGTLFQAPDQSLNNILEKRFKSEEPSPNYFSFLLTLAPIILVLFLLYLIFFRQMKGGVGGGAMNFGKSPAKLFTEENSKITFKDVAGIDEAREELEEIVDFLKSPDKFTTLGGRIPKGVLCIGAPGTGKTLIARAVAGEAKRPFFSISGSDFVEMFVGVGASRIRDLFTQAKKHAPCIVFIDEIDAVGRHRGGGHGGGHDEREQTLNQLLVEMDGFGVNEGIILMAATNRPDVLDRALLRPGRFDRRIILDLPDIKGRYEILKVHAKKIKLDTSVDLMDIARTTPGSSGADLANLLNEAALLAARRGRKSVTAQETMEAADKVKYGKARKSLEIEEAEKKTTAYHESGHAIVALVLKEGIDPIEKVTIIPRGLSLGATHFLPKKNKLSYWKKEIVNQLAVLMGGRIAEDVFVGDISSGAQQDIREATRLARSMVCEWGMSEILGQVAYDERSDQNTYLGGVSSQPKKYSDETAQIIDKEVKSLTHQANDTARSLILENRDKVELMTNMLIEFETLDSEDLDLIMQEKWDVEEKKKRLKEQELLHRSYDNETSAKDNEPKVSTKDKEDNSSKKEENSSKKEDILSS